MLYLSIVLFAAGILFCAAGTAGYFRLRDFYARLLIGSNIDSVGMMFILAGAMAQSPSPAFLLKTLLILVLALITGPLSSHATARSAHSSGYRVR